MNESVLGREHNAALEKRDGEAVHDHRKCTQTYTNGNFTSQAAIGELFENLFLENQQLFQLYDTCDRMFSQERRESIDIKVIIYL